MKQTCEVCFHHCKLAQGQVGLCKARMNQEGGIIPTGYSELTALALDPIEKKPLADFYSGTNILSVSSYGCNLSCPFCQNADIADADSSIYTRHFSPEQLCELAVEYQAKKNIGIAYTYNEPLVSWEFVRDTALRIHALGMKNVLITNGTAEINILEELLPYIDAMNIDLKGFTREYYQFVGGDFEQTKAFIARAVQDCHVELTTLIIPGMNDSESDMRREADWIAGLAEGAGKDIPLHVTRFFPTHRLTDRAATDVKAVYHLAAVAGEYLPKVYVGNC